MSSKASGLLESIAKEYRVNWIASFMSLEFGESEENFHSNILNKQEGEISGETQWWCVMNTCNV